VKRRRRGDTAARPDRGPTAPDSSGVGAVSGEQGSEGRNSVAGRALRKSSKRGESHGRQSGATPRHGRGGANRRGGAKPRGRNTVGAGRRRPEGRSRKGSSGSGLHDRARRRDDLRQPQERQPGVPTSGGRSRMASGKTASKGTREIGLSIHVERPAPDDGPRSHRVHRESGTQRRTWRAAAKQRAATSPGAFPTVGGPTSRSVAAERRAVVATRGGGRIAVRSVRRVDGSPTVVREAERRQRCRRSNP